MQFFFKFKKVESLLSVNIKELDRALIVATYYQLGELYVVVISELSNLYYNTENRPILFNYNSYKEICNLMGEGVMTFKQFEEIVLSENLSVNSFEKVDGKLLNFNQQLVCQESV